MKNKRLWIAGIAIATTISALQSCLNDDKDDSLSFPTALVTIKPNADNSAFSMQLNDSTVLLPANMKGSPYGRKEVRALVNYTPVERRTEHTGMAVNVHWIDSIRTKAVAENLGDKNVEKYGNDPVEIVNDWVSIAEDGYLTLRFRTRWNSGVKHHVNLVVTPYAKDAYRVTFYHNAMNDLHGSRVGDGLVAFKLNGLPDTQGKYVWLTLEWNSYSGKKTARFKYCTRKNSAASQAKMAAMTAPVQITAID